MSSTARWRRASVAGCLVLLAISAPAAVLANWLNGLVQDTDRYVSTVAPLADDPDVQDAVADRVSDALTEGLDIQAIAESAADALAKRGLPDRLADSLSQLGDPLAASVNDYIHDHVLALVRSPEFSTAWERANREAHDQLDAVLTGDGDGAVEVDDDGVRLDLAVVIDTARATLSDDGFHLLDRLPEVTAEFTVLEGADLAKLQSLARVLVAADQVLPVVALVSAIGAVIASRSRRRGLGAVGVVLAGSMLVLWLAVQALRTAYLADLPPEASSAAAAAIFDQVVAFVHQVLWSLLGVGLTVALVAWAALRWGTRAPRRDRDPSGPSHDDR